MYQYQYHCVPDFEPHSVPCETKLDDDDDDEHESLMPMSMANSSAETELLELVWRKGPVLSPLRGGARIRNPDPGGRADATLPVRADGSVAEVATQLFAEEDEMASWLNYHIGEIENGRGGDLCSATPRPPPPDANPARATGESTIVGSNLTPAVEPAKAAAPGSARRTGFSRNPSSNWDRASSLRKRKTSEEDEFEYQSGEDGEFEFDDEKKDLRRSVAPRRSRAAEVHNLSERRRRDRINEKMKTLQELIPRCNKSDKASMLDEAIAYLKSLQLQVQVMSMGCSLNPVMFPGVQSFLQPMPMGMGMGMGMGMEMEMGMGIGSGNTMATEMQIGGMGIPVPSFGPLLQCLPLAASAQPQSLMASFHPPNCTNPDQVRAQANNQQALPFNSLCMQNPHTGQIQPIGDPYHYHLALNQQHQVLPQNKVTGEAGNSNKKEDKKGTKVG